MIGRFLRLLPIAFISLPLALGCGKNQASVTAVSGGEEAPKQKPAPSLPSIADFGPLDTKPGSQLLTAQQSKLPVTMAVSQKGDNVSISLLVNETLVEAEQYSQKDGGLSLISASDFTCAPPIPLFSKVATIGKQSAWQGMVMIAGKSFSAKAEIGISPSEVRAADLDPLAAYEVDVDLSFGDPSGKPLRESFWLAPGLGIVKRNFASDTSREPSAP